MNISYRADVKFLKRTKILIKTSRELPTLKIISLLGIPLAIIVSPQEIFPYTKGVDGC